MSSDDEREELREFAIKTLSASPTGSFVERSFSLQGSIHNKVTNRLKREEVAMIMFCRWNKTMMKGRHMINRKQFVDTMF